MANTVKENIINLFSKKNDYQVKEIVEILSVSKQVIHRSLKALVDDGFLQKVGSAPKVFYTKATDSKQQEIVQASNIKPEYKLLLEDEFLLIEPDGKRFEGVQGFELWCKDRKQPVEKTASEYYILYNKYAKYRQGGLIDGTQKFIETFRIEMYLNKVLYADFYAIDRFGKTKLGQLLLYAKNSQDKKIIKEISQNVRGKILDLIEKEKIEAVGFIPPTVKRQVQFMTELQKNLKLTLPTISIEKARTEVVVPQKTLSKPADRIRNAEQTIFVTDSRKYTKILLIDDAIGSGATLNQTAKKIMTQGNAKIVIGFAITGSANGFEIINEA